MGKIKNIKSVKKNLKLGEVKATTVWAYDEQSKLKGNSVKAFEKDLRRICKFKILKKGRDKIYEIQEIFSNILDKAEHKNKVALKGNENKKGSFGFNNWSRSKFIASVVINKIEYFEILGTNDYKTIGQHMKSFGLYSEKNEQVNDVIRSSLIYTLKKMDNLGYVQIKMKYFKVSSGNLTKISKTEYDRIKMCEQEEFKRLVTEEVFKKYKCLYNYSKYSKSYIKESVLLKIKEASMVDYTFKMYLIKKIEDINLAFDEKYLNMIFEVFRDDIYREGNTPQNNIKEFIEHLEEHYENKSMKFKIKKFEIEHLRERVRSFDI